MSNFNAPDLHVHSTFSLKGAVAVVEQVSVERIQEYLS